MALSAAMAVALGVIGLHEPAPRNSAASAVAARAPAPPPAKAASSRRDTGLQPAPENSTSSAAAKKWQVLTARDDANAILMALVHSDNPEDWRTGARLSAICLAGRTTTDELIAAYAGTHPADPSLPTSQLIARAKTARNKIAQTCAGLQAQAWEAAVTELRRKAVSSTGISRLVSGMPADTQSDQWTQEQVQGAIAILSRPKEYAAAIDAFLERSFVLPSLNEEPALTFTESRMARHRIYQELTADTDPESLHNLHACMSFLICDSQALQNNPRIESTVKRAVQLVSSQDWWGLGLLR